MLPGRRINKRTDAYKTTHSLPRRRRHTRRRTMLPQAKKNKAMPAGCWGRRMFIYNVQRRRDNADGGHAPSTEKAVIVLCLPFQRMSNTHCCFHAEAACRLHVLPARSNRTKPEKV